MLFDFFSICGFGMLMMSVVLLLIINYVFKYGLLIFYVVEAHANCCFSCAFCTVDYECAKNIHAFGCCKFDIHEPILTTFGRNVTEEVHSQKMLFSYLI